MITFTECLMEVASNEEIVKEFDRLRGTNLQFQGSNIERMIDEATGRIEHDLALFVEFVYECIWIRLPPDIRQSYPCAVDDTPLEEVLTDGINKVLKKAKVK